MKLLTDTGYTPISRLNVGDTLLNKDGDPQNITEIITTKFRILYKINGILIISPLQPILMCDGVTKAIADMRLDSQFPLYTVGFGMITSYGEVLKIDEIEVLDFEEAVEVFAVVTDGDGTYFANGVCVCSWVNVTHPRFIEYNGEFTNVVQLGDDYG